MSASLSWIPVKSNDKCFATGSRYVTALEKAFGPVFPMRIGSNPDNRAVLKGLIAAGLDDLQEVLDALYEHDEIEIRADY